MRSPSSVESNLFGDSSATAGVGSLSGKLNPNMSQEEYNEALKNANPEDIKNAMKAMDSMLDSNVFDEYLSDDAKLETARQQMLANVDQYATMMPGFKVGILSTEAVNYRIFYIWNCYRSKCLR